jgi:hypothetical protein
LVVGLKPAIDKRIARDPEKGLKSGSREKSATPEAPTKQERKREGNCLVELLKREKRGGREKKRKREEKEKALDSPTHAPVCLRPCFCRCLQNG